jgi:hypothetical protein
MTGDAKPKKKARWTAHGRLRERERLVRAREDLSAGAVRLFAVVAQGVKVKTGRFKAIDEEMEVRAGGVSRSTLSRYRRELHDAGELDFEPGHPGVPTEYWLPERSDDEIQLQLNELNRRVAAAYRKAADDGPERKSRVANLRRGKAVEVGVGDTHIQPAVSQICDTVASQNCDTYLPEPISLIPFLEREDSYDLQAEFLFEEEKESTASASNLQGSDVEDGISGGSKSKETREHSGEPGGAPQPRPRLVPRRKSAPDTRSINDVLPDSRLRDYLMEEIGENPDESDRRMAMLGPVYFERMWTKIQAAGGVDNFEAVDRAVRLARALAIGMEQAPRVEGWAG